MTKGMIHICKISSQNIDNQKPWSYFVEEICKNLYERKLVVSTQEEAESSSLCEDTSGAHPLWNVYLYI